MHDPDSVDDLGDGMTNAEIGRALLRIEAKVSETNGRVKAIELWKARLDGAKSAMGWMQPAVVGVVSGGLVALLAHYIG